MHTNRIKRKFRHRNAPTSDQRAEFPEINFKITVIHASKIFHIQKEASALAVTPHFHLAPGQPLMCLIAMHLPVLDVANQWNRQCVSPCIRPLSFGMFSTLTLVWELHFLQRLSDSVGWIYVCSFIYQLMSICTDSTFWPP